MRHFQDEDGRWKYRRMDYWKSKASVVDEFYPFNRLFLHLAFHIVALGMCMHLVHRLILPVFAWVHMIIFLIYTCLEVFSHPSNPLV